MKVFKYQHLMQLLQRKLPQHSLNGWRNKQKHSPLLPLNHLNHAFRLVIVNLNALRVRKFGDITMCFTLLVRKRYYGPKYLLVLEIHHHQHFISL